MINYGIFDSLHSDKLIIKWTDYSAQNCESSENPTTERKMINQSFNGENGIEYK